MSGSGPAARGPAAQPPPPALPEFACPRPPSQPPNQPTPPPPKNRQGQGPDTATWLPRDDLVEMGFERLVNELDAKEAARQGLMLRPLTKANVEKHLGVLGLEPEFATHAHMRGLSGGQKVKVVLAACTWNQPHILVMDEPTNYLDR